MMLPLLLGQCDDVLKSKLWNRVDFMDVDDEGRLLNPIDAINEEGCVLC